MRRTLLLSGGKTRKDGLEEREKGDGTETVLRRSESSCWRSNRAGEGRESGAG